jgi:hypothetical protein
MLHNMLSFYGKEELELRLTPRWEDNFNISGFHIVVLFNLSEEKLRIPSNTTK